jgi:5-(carboxyamino)imidazole ribonucleotide synthase
VTAPIQPGAVLGVLGGGQLGRMFNLAARSMGYRVSVLVPQDDSPTGQIAHRVEQADYTDVEAVERFARDVAVVTFEFENVPAQAVEAAARHAPVRPAGELLFTTQDRSREKAALTRLGLPVAPYGYIESADDLPAAAEAAGFPAVLKTASWGYDGKGQRRVEDAEQLAAAWTELGEQPAVLEGFIDFVAELSVVGARGVDGTVALYEPVLNRHRNHILHLTLCPAPLPGDVRDAAQEIARNVLEGLDVVGVLCVELFLLADGRLLVNELAPRPHNSGHVTIDAHTCSQFEQQVRAVCGLPLGSTERVVPAAAMVNLMGELWSEGEPDWSAALADPGARLHLYGKEGPARGRKMGHLTVADATVEGAERRALQALAAVAPGREQPAQAGA